MCLFTQRGGASRVLEHTAQKRPARVTDGAEITCGRVMCVVCSIYATKQRGDQREERPGPRRCTLPRLRPCACCQRRSSAASSGAWVRAPPTCPAPYWRPSLRLGLRTQFSLLPSPIPCRSCFFVCPSVYPPCRQLLRRLGITHVFPRGRCLRKSPSGKCARRTFVAMPRPPFREPLPPSRTPLMMRSAQPRRSTHPRRRCRPRRRRRPLVW